MAKTVGAGSVLWEEQPAVHLLLKQHRKQVLFRIASCSLPEQVCRTMGGGFCLGSMYFACSVACLTPFPGSMCLDW